MGENQSPPCEVCGKVFASNSALYKHLRTIHDIQPKTGKSARFEASGDFQCYVCDKSFAQKWSVTRHLKDIHHVETQEQPSETSAAFRCDLCIKSYLQKKDLNHHMKMKHPSEPLSGDEVGEPSSTSTDASENIQCDLCSQKFTLRSSVVRHLKKVHSVVSSKNHEEGGERFPCEFCNKSYMHKKDLYLHIRAKHSDVKNTDADADNEVDDPSDSQHTERERLPCPVCTKTYSCKYRHIQQKHSPSKGETTSIPEGRYELTNLTLEEEPQISPRERLNSLLNELFDLSSQLSDVDSISETITEVQHLMKSVLLPAAEKSGVYSAPA